MEFSYTVTLDDYVAFNRHFFKKSAAARGVILMVWVLPPLASFAGAVLVALGEGPSPNALILAVTGVVYAAAFWPLYHGLFGYCIGAFARSLGTRGIVGRTTLVLSEEGMLVVTEVGRAEVKWENMEGVDVVGDHTFIFVTELSAAILPRKGFDRAEDYEQARDFALARVARRS